MSSPAAKFDHAVINTLYDMDAAQQQFAGIGFTLTERGYHTLGSINHLMMFGTDYLELIGLPAAGDGEPPQRPGISDAPPGINGLVFKTADADATYRHLQAVGYDDRAPNAFSRPVVLADGTHDACFRTVHVRRDAFAAGRVYFCEHQTPHLVWQPQWQSHANTAQSIAELVVVSADPAGQAERFASLLAAPSQEQNAGHAVAIDGGKITILGESAYQARYGELASKPAGRSEYYGALVIRCADPEQVRSSLADSSWKMGDGPSGSVIARNDSFDSLLQFVPA